MAAAIRCGPRAVLSHQSAAALWEIAPERLGRIELSLPAPATTRSVPGLIVHRRAMRPEDVTTHRGIPVTTPVCTLIDVASRLPLTKLEAAINEADRRELTDPEALRSSLPAYAGRRGIPALREVL